MSYGRRLNIKVGDVEIVNEDSRDLRVAFDVSRDKSRDPNAAVFTIWGLADSTRQKFEEVGRAFAECEAGYADESVHNIFSGVLLDVRTDKDSDGGRFVELSLGDDADEKTVIRRIHRNFGANTPVSTVLRELVRATGLEADGLSRVAGTARIDGKITLDIPWLATGQALSELHHFTRSAGIRWSIQDQKISFFGVTPPDFKQGPLFTDENMFPGVQVDAEGNISLASTLVPELRPGKAFRVESEKATGNFVATQTQHVGDTRGTDWSIAVVGEPFDTSVRKGLVVNGA